MVVINPLTLLLNPPDSDIQASHKRAIIDAQQFANKLSIVVLSADKDEVDNLDDAKQDQNTRNQKLGVVEALLHIGDWEQACALINRLPPFFAVAHQPVAEAICKVIHHIIEPLYKRSCGLPSAIIRKWSKSSLPDSRGLDQATTFSDLLKVAFPMLSHLGPHLSCDTLLMAKMLRLARAFMHLQKKQGSALKDGDDIFRGFLTLVDEVLLPSLSLLPCNCCISEEVWSFLRLLKYEHRYRLYGQWKNESHVVHPKLIRARAEVIDRAKYIMKRLAKENVKPLGRQIGKLSHSNPGVLFEYVLSQIQRYDNFIGPVVDSLKYLTSLSYDALAYCIIEALANPERERMKLDDTNISLWLQSLANFSGTVFKKYQIELTGLLQYVANQLKACKSVDLLILREVIMKMAGIEISEEITSDQLEAMSGGELLKQEGGYFIQVRNTKKSSSRLKDTLQERRLAIPLCLLMAQQKYGIIFPPNKMTDDNRHLKLIGRLYDQCQDTFVQFVSFLNMQLSTDELSRRLPPIDQLIQVYNLNVESAFSLSRGIYCSAINAKYLELLKPDRKKQSQKKQSSQSQSQKTQHYIAAVEHVMTPLSERVAPIYPPKVWEDMSLQLFLTFWSLSLYDLQVPSAAYRRQTQQLEQQLNAVEENKEVVQSKKKKEKEKMQSVMQKLREEEEKQQQHVNLVLARLRHEKDSWFISKTQKHATMILQMCLFPRSCFTAPDAVYCAKFLLTIHSLKTPNFSSLICYDRIFTDITWPMTSCSENEAHRYGRFLCAVLDDISRWHADKSVYEKECFSHPGFVTVFRAPSRGQTNTTADQLDFENYRHVCHKWHHCLTKVMVHCLESGDFQQMRNALIVLTRVLAHYPKVIKLGQALERRVDRVCQQEKVKRPDLWAFAMGYAGQLKVKRKMWISEADFHKLDTDANKPKSNSSNSVKQDPGKAAPPSSNSGRTVQAVKSEHNQGKERSSNSNKDMKTEVTVKSENRQSRGGDDSRGNGRGGEHSRSNSRGGDDIRNNSRGGDDMRGNSRGSDDGRNSGHGSGADSKGARVDKKEGGSHSDRKAEKEKRESLKDAKERGSPMLGREKDKTRDKEPREKEVTPGHHDDSRKEKSSFLPRSHSSDERENERDVERMTAGHGHRRSAEPSPKHIDERDMKRRKIESCQTAKDPSHYHLTETCDKSHKSPAHDRSIEKLEKKKDRLEKRREKIDEDEIKEGKRHKSEDNIGKLSKVNGHEKPVRSKSKDKAKSNERDEIMNHSNRKSKKDSPPEKEKRSSEKYSSKKSSKHH
ncbi:THO complex subunit 2 [Lamellibrachia satsuma]|nr:THO complex subunit 2 [Lamellibrachia satsuma]